MYAAYLYIFRAFESASESRLARSLDPEREIADDRWPSVAVSRCDSRSPARPDSAGTLGISTSAAAKARWTATAGLGA